MKQTNFYLSYLFCLCLIIVSCQKEPPPIDEIPPPPDLEMVVLADTIELCDTDYFIDLDLDGIDDLRFSAYCTSADMGQFHASSQNWFPLEPNVTVALESFTDYKCLDTLYNYDGYDGFYFYMCDGTSSSVYDTIMYESVKVFTSVEDVQPSEEDFRDDIAIIRQVEYKEVTEPYPDR